MKKWTQLFLIAFIILQSVEHHFDLDSEQFHTYYYSTIQFVETPLSPIKGSISLTRQEAMQRNHYRFIYNEKHELNSISFYNGRYPKNPNHTANLFTLSHRMEYSIHTESDTITFYNPDGNQVAVLGNCFALAYSKNKLGFRTRLHFLDQNGERIENSWGIYEYTWDYEKDGSVIENRFNDQLEPVSIRPGFEFHRLRLRFNHLGNIVLMQNIDDQGNLIENESGASQDRIITNAQGHFLEWNVLDNEGQLERGNGPDVAVGRQTFNAYGYETTLEHLDEDGNSIENSYGICKSEAKFDRFGNMIERAIYDEQNRPSLHGQGGFHKYKIVMDSSGNHRKAIKYFDIENKPTLHKRRGYHAALYKYDRNHLQRIRFVDIDGGLVNRKDTGIAYCIVSRKETGEASRINYNKEGQIIRP